MIFSGSQSTSSILGNQLVHNGLIKSDSLADAMQQAKREESSLVSFLVKNNILSSQLIMETCINSFGLTPYDLGKFDITSLKNNVLSLENILYYRVIPISKTKDILQIGLSDPTDQAILDAITFHTGLRVSPFVVDETLVCTLLKKISAQEIKFESTFLKKISREEPHREMDDYSISQDEPLIQFVDQLIQHAISLAASDIHIEPYAEHCRVRFRRDGILYEITTIPSELVMRVMTRLKVMAKLDIAERRMPQDGRFKLETLDIRISTCPTLFGEKIVLRLLDPHKISLDINALGFEKSQKELFIKNITAPQGLILVTGPTGSGKTLTLYSALQYLNSIDKNISTVEDPVEIQLNGINQIAIQPKIGLHFATVLRTLLRQDPDIIMVGEIRDQETAEIAIQAAHTGHLVLSTLHTNSALETIARLKSINITPYNIASAISLIIAQRLIRKLCPLCKQEDSIAANVIGLSNDDVSKKIFRNKGCGDCLSGYQGRTGIYELLPMTDKLVSLILMDKPLLEFPSDYFSSYCSLKKSGLNAVLAGATSLSEINRVLIN